MSHTELILEILPQPTDETCGPTCLQAVYGYLGDPLPLDQVIAEVKRLGTGGTLAPYLGLHALDRGFHATLYTYNLRIFDPTWFADPDAEIVPMLLEQAAAKHSSRLRSATAAYVDFIEAGGSIRFEELSPDLVRRPLMRGFPIMTGLSATYLYGSARERYTHGEATYDSIRGDPTGHYVVVHGYDPATDSVLVADPYLDNPFASGSSYRVGIVRLLGSIMLGVLSYDGNLLVIEQRTEDV